GTDDAGLARGHRDGEQARRLGPAGDVGAGPQPDDRQLLGVLADGPRVVVDGSTGRLGGHGASPTVLSPEVSSSPSARIMHCTAAPAVPLARLSTAPTATGRPAAASTVTWTWRALAPSTAWVCGHCPSGSRWTKGSGSYALA